MPHRADSGFSIIEVLLALAVVTLAIVSLMRGTAVGIQSAGSAERHGQALSLARSLLARSGVEAPFETGEQAGTTDDGFTWTVAATEHRKTDDPAQVRAAVRGYWVRVHVAWKESRSGRPGHVRLAALKLVERR